MGSTKGTEGLEFELSGDSYRVIGCSTTSGGVIIPACCNDLSVTEIGKEAFICNMNLRTVTFAEGSRLQSIGESAFALSSLINMEIPDSVVSIGKSAFVGCECLIAITIPASVTDIGKGAFNGCAKLACITVDKNNPCYMSEGGILYDKAKTTLIAYPTANGNVTIPDTLTSIGFYAFAGCADLTGITIPSSVTSIGKAVFEGCTGLTAITIPANVTSIGNYAFNYCTGLAAVTFEQDSRLERIGNYAFKDCASIAEIIIPPGVKSVGLGAFDGWGSGGTIIVPFAGEAEADAAWGGGEDGWRYNCNAGIIPDSLTFGTKPPRS